MFIASLKPPKKDKSNTDGLSLFVGTKRALNLSLQSSNETLYSLDCTTGKTILRCNIATAYILESY
jgi:hypothetical protein